MTKKKFLILASLAAIAFALGYGMVAKAFPTPYHYGYFLNRYDDPGTEVLPPWGGPTSLCYADGLAIPMWVDTADDFVYWVNCKLKYADYHSHVGAAYIISTMTGKVNLNPDQAQIDDFSARVHYLESLGRINWHGPQACYLPNTYYQPVAQDVAAYGGCGTSSEPIIFNRDGGSSLYIIKRLCANPVGDMGPLPAVWNATGGTTVTDSAADPGDTPTSITTQPGDTLHFVHSITNNGPSPSGNIWYALHGHPNATPFTGQYYNNTTLSGAPAMTRTDPGQLNFSWGNGSPGGSIGIDNFSVRWSKTEYLTAGSYTFEAVADDGVRLYVDGSLVIDKWIDQGPTKYIANVGITEGNHTITMEYYERSGNATAYLYYYMPVQAGINSSTYTIGQTKTFNQDVVVPANAAPGTKICRRVLWDWKNDKGLGDFAPYATWGMGGAACATVSSNNFNLSPLITVLVNGVPPTAGSVIEPGDQLEFDYAIVNSGLGPSNIVDCTIFGKSFAGYHVSTNPAESTAGWGTITGTGTGCPRSFPTGRTDINIGDITTMNAANLNTSICRVLTVNPASAGGPPASTESCVQVGAKPYMRVYGGDVSAGNGQPTACVDYSGAAVIGWNKEAAGAYAGAGAQYATLALSTIFDFATALGNAGGAPVGSGLAFANTATSGGTMGGSFGSLPCVTDYYAAKPSSAGALATTDISGLATGAYTFTGNTTLRGTVGAGKRLSIFVQGDVLIDGNITYPANWTSGSTPLLELAVKGNIFISQSVTQLDGVYIAQLNGGSGGTIYTCANTTLPATQVLTTSATFFATCKNKLTINGSFVAQQVQFLRTFGTQGQSAAGESAAGGAAAEVFNYSPALWMVAPPNQAETNGYDSIVSLPPIL